MSPLEAFQCLAAMADRAHGNGADHRAVTEAIEVLAKLVSTEPTEPTEPVDLDVPDADQR